MSLINKLAQEEKKGMMSYINENIHISSKTDIETILRLWDKNKSEYLYQLFGGKFILSKDFEYEMDLYEKEEEMRKLLRGHPLVIKFNDWAFVNSVPVEAYSLIYSLTLAENIYTGRNFEIKLPNDKILKVQHGSKVIRTLRKIATAFDFSEEFEDFRLKHSLILNQKKLKGTLCISIHPLDYMTMSDNNCGWDSCMSWTANGEYRRGTIEMMNSPMVVVAYLDSEHSFEVSNSLEWSNKKWRELFIVNRDIITGVKQYPYENKYLEKEVCDWLKTLAETNLNWSYHNTLIDYTHKERFTFEDKEFRIVFETCDMYNDFGSCEHIGYISTEASGYIGYDYSGPTVCLCCGTEDAYYDIEQDLVCENCDTSTKCSCCGERFFDSDDIVWIRDIPYCVCCSNELNVETCNLCGETIYTDLDDYKDIYLAIMNKDEKIEVWSDRYYHKIVVCDKHELTRYPKYFKDTVKIYTVQKGWRVYDCVLIEDCTDTALEELFDYDFDE